jgi:hypothetical protein
MMKHSASFGSPEANSLQQCCAIATVCMEEILLLERQFDVCLTSLTELELWKSANHLDNHGHQEGDAECMSLL